MSVAIMFDPKTQKVINEAQKKVMGATCENVCADGMIQGYIELYSTGLYKSVKDMVYKTATPIIGNDADGEPIYQPKESVYQQIADTIGVDKLAKKAEEFKNKNDLKIGKANFKVAYDTLTPAVKKGINITIHNTAGAQGTLAKKYGIGNKTLQKAQKAILEATGKKNLAMAVQEIPAEFKEAHPCPPTKAELEAKKAQKPATKATPKAAPKKKPATPKPTAKEVQAALSMLKKYEAAKKELELAAGDYKTIAEIAGEFFGLDLI